MSAATILVPTTGHGPLEVTGTVMWFEVGGKRVKFLCHQSLRSDEGKVLTHFASGMCVGKLGNIRLGAYIALGRKISDRDAAKKLVDQAVERNGAENVLAKIAEAKIINGD